MIHRRADCTPAGEVAPLTKSGSRRRRSNRPGNSQAKGLRAEGRSGKQRAGIAAHPLTEGVSPHPPASRASGEGTDRSAGESLRVHDRGGIGDAAASALCRRCPGARCRCRRAAAQADAALRAPPIARRQDGAVRRLRDAGAVSAGILNEHLHTRAQAGLFDVSHMGQALAGADPAAALETLVPGDISGLGADADALHAAAERRGRHHRRFDGDAARRRAASSSSTPRPRTPTSLICATISAAPSTIERLDDRALLALQGPQAAAVLARARRGIARLTFMTAAAVDARRPSLPRHPLRLHRRGRL